MLSSVSSWLLAICGVIILSVVAEFVLPDGQINKYIRFIFSIITLFVVICPIGSMLDIDIDFSSIFTSDEISYQEDYLYQINTKKLLAITDEANEAVSDMGFFNVEISISANVFTAELEIYEIFVDLSNLTYSDSVETKTKAYAKEKISEILEYMNTTITFSG